MRGRTTIGFSYVAHKWKIAYYAAKKGDSFSVVRSIAGEPSETLDLGDAVIYTYISREWKGLFRGGVVERKMTFVVKEDKIISKNEININMSAG